MKKLLKLLTMLTLVLSLSACFIACDKGETSGDSGDATTGELVFELATGERVINEETGEKEEYDYYKITGYTVTSDDALKMANGDFSSVAGKRVVTIPATHGDNVPVEEISPSAFADKVIIQKIVFENGNNIKTIGSGAFSGCTNLEEIENLPFVGKSADAVGEERVLGYVFGSSSTLTNLTTVTAKVYDEVTTTDFTYKFPANLKKISVASASIPECAFYGMTMLETVTFAKATKIGASAFSGCTKLIDVSFPATLTHVFANAFSGCTALQRVAFNEGLIYIGDGAFKGCTYLGYNYVSDVNGITLPSTVTNLGKNAFADCALLENVVLGAGITEIKTGTFANCTELVSVVSNASDVTVNLGAFKGCDKESLVVKVGGAEGTVKGLDDLAFGEYNV